ncbi:MULTISPECIES: hypothetical protein [Clostridia]|nr:MULTISPECIES: hypothetical protein [Clostridia]
MKATFNHARKDAKKLHVVFDEVSWAAATENDVDTDRLQERPF